MELKADRVTAVLTLRVEDRRVVMECAGARMIMTTDQARQLARDLDHIAVELMVLPPKACTGKTMTLAAAAGPPCAFCGGATQRSGTCFTCQQCGETTGCG